MTPPKHAHIRLAPTVSRLVGAAEIGAGAGLLAVGILGARDGKGGPRTAQPKDVVNAAAAGFGLDLMLRGQGHYIRARAVEALDEVWK